MSIFCNESPINFRYTYILSSKIKQQQSYIKDPTIL